jgi:hypothetical protein
MCFLSLERTLYICAIVATKYETRIPHLCVLIGARRVLSGYITKDLAYVIVRSSQMVWSMYLDKVTHYTIYVAHTWPRVNFFFFWGGMIQSFRGGRGENFRGGLKKIVNFRGGGSEI